MTICNHDEHHYCGQCYGDKEYQRGYLSGWERCLQEVAASEMREEQTTTLGDYTRFRHALERIAAFADDSQADDLEEVAVECISIAKHVLKHEFK